MNAAEIVEELKSLGTPTYKATMLKHGAKEPIFGVKVEDLKKYQKRLKTNYQLALDLYDTGISDAMYLAGLIADDARMTQKDLNRWVKKASFPLHSENTVPWVAAGSPVGWELALEWIDSKAENVAAAGWATLSSSIAIKQDADIDLAVVKKLLARVETTIHQQPNRVRSVMNSFVMAVGTRMTSLSNIALKTAEKIGPVSVDVGDTACKVPNAADAIKKAKQAGTIGKKRTTAKC